MSRRKKDQGLDFLVSILKAIAKNREGYTAPQLSVMLAAADRLAQIDRTAATYKPAEFDQQRFVASNPEGAFSDPKKKSPVAAMLKQLEEQHAEATDPSKQDGDGEGIREAMDSQGSCDLHG